jgi:hypothetical protein
MQKKNHILSIIILIFVVAVLAGCAAFTTSNKGLMALNDHTISFKKPLKTTESWQTKDVLVSYSINKSSSSFSITGSLHIADSIISSFPIADYFNLYLTFVDSSGLGLITHSIGPLFPYKMEVPEKLEFKKELLIPTGAAAYVFSYSGRFRDNVGADGGGGSWDISFRPFSEVH